MALHPAGCVVLMLLLLLLLDSSNLVCCPPCQPAFCPYLFCCCCCSLCLASTSPSAIFQPELALLRLVCVRLCPGCFKDSALVPGQVPQGRSSSSGSSSRDWQRGVL
jgi:hypothetical protein